MLKKSLQNYLAKSSLNITFVLIILLSTLLPLALSLFLLVSNYEHERIIADQTNIVVEEESKRQTVQVLKELQSELKIATQNQTIVDLLSAPKNVRSFIENRAYGILSELKQNSKIPLEFALVSSQDTEAIFASTQFERSFLGIKKENPIFLTGNYIVLYEEIKFDDQNLPGPNAKIKGHLVATIDSNDLKLAIPKLKRVISIVNGGEINIEIFEVKNRKLVVIVTTTLIFLSLFASIFLGLVIFQKRIISPLKNISQKLQTTNKYEDKNEISTLETVIENHISNLKSQEHEKSEKEKLIASNLIASQVAHDIRSPLTALNMVIGTIDKLPEDKRILIRNAIQRINDIANDLLARGKANSLNNPSSISEIREDSIAITMLSSLVDMLISEKRTQLRNEIGIQIGAEFSKSYGLFSKIPTNEFKRVLSNLINNSVEALPAGHGKIFVTLDDYANFNKIEIIDNGKGIPDSVLSKLGAAGVTFGKEGSTSGSGLGIYHAKNFIASIGGTIEFVNNPPPENGVTVKVCIPKTQPPIWFVEKVAIPIGGKIVALDDDQSIHGVWQGRLSSLKANEKSVALLSFTSAEGFKNWVRNQGKFGTETVFLVDYELLGQKIIGLDIVEDLGLQKNTILVSSRYDERSVYERCKRLGIKIIPKAMAGLVPIEILDREDSLDAILIDDDSLVHMTWSISAKQNEKKFLGFKDPVEFLSQANRFSLNTPIIIDLQLSNGVQGDVVAKQISELGFNNIFFGTGQSISSVPSFPGLKGTIGKAPDWEQFTKS